MKSKAQIAIEFLIVFAFILLVFLFLFSLITQQRAVIQNTQTYSQLQLIAQNIALQISRAALSGSGYSAQLPLLTSVGVIPYNLSITSSGAVIVTSTTAQQAVRATAFSSARGLSSNPAYLASGSNTVYNIPIANGSISIQNSFGTVCIDYQCPTNANQSSSISLSSQVIHAAQFNGAAGGSQFSGSDSNSVQSNTGQGFSVSAWVYPTDISTSRGITQGDSYVFRIDSPGEGNKLSWFVYINSAIEPRLSSTGVLKLNKWYHVVGTYNSSTGYMGLYINGVLNNSETRAGSPTLGYCSCFNIGVGSSSDWAGKIANLQIYNAGLSANQVKALYSNGIAGGPVNSTYLKGWWTLNGNANDYSGYGENLVGGTVLFPTVAQIFAAVKNPTGQAVNNILVGFATTLGNFTNGIGAQGQSSAAYTNSNGVAFTFLNQQGNNGQVFVKATALNGNFLPQSNLVAWYPLNLGQGGAAYDLSGNNNNGTFVGQPSWDLPNYVANFSGHPALPTGQTQSISIHGQSPLKTSPTSSITLTAWINTSQYSSYPTVIGEGNSPWNFLIELCSNSGTIGFYSSGIGGWFCGNSPVPLSKWTFISVTWDGSTVKFYQNGHQDGQASASGTIPAATLPWFIGSRLDGYPFYGQIADVQVYSSALSLSQLQQLYQGGISGSPMPNSGLDSWWPLNGDANDYSGNLNNGVIYNRLNFVPASQTIPPQQISSGNLGKVLAANFLASNSIPIPSANILNPTNAISISAWIYPAESQIKVIAAKNNILSGAGIDYELLMYNQNLHFGLAKGGSTTVLASNSIISLNSWHYVTGTWDGSTMKIYIDGTQDSNTIALSNNIDTSQNALTIGAYWNGGYPFNGLISNVQIYNTSLSSAQVLQSYLLGVGGTPSSNLRPVGWWPLNGNANDYSLYGHNGTSANVVYKNMIDYAPFLLYGANYSGVNFNGQTSYILTTSTQAISGSRSVVAWVYVPGPYGGLGSPIFTSGLSGAADLFGITGANGAACSGKLKIYIDHWGTQCDLSSATVNTNSWNQVAYSYNSSSSIIKLYINGQDAGCTTGSCSTLYSYTMNTMRIGGNTAGGSTTNSSFYGGITNIQIYNAALSASQINQLYNSQIPPSASTTIPLSWSP